MIKNLKKISLLFFLLTSSTPAFAINLFGAGPPESFAKLIEKVSPAVVNIYTTKNSVSEGLQSYFNKVYPKSAPQKPNQKNSLGTGFIISEDGKVITNEHVIAGADEIFITLNDGKEVKATLIGSDSKLDIAVLQINDKGHYPQVGFGDANKSNAGDWVIAIGNPFGLGQTVTMGIISAKGRVLGAGPFDDFIQTDAAIHPGNSGGPLLNIDGNVIGVNTLIVDGQNQGFGFAIPIHLAKNAAEQIVKTGQVKRGWLGIIIKDLNDTEAKKMGISQKSGILIIEITENSPAHKAGLHAGDLITVINDVKIETRNDFARLLSHLPPGKEVGITFYRGDKKAETRTVLGDLDNPHKSFVFPLAQKDPAKGQIGFDVRDLEKEDAIKKGAYITKIHPETLAEKFGMQRGDVIIGLNGKDIDSVKNFKKVLDKINLGEIIALKILRGNASLHFAFKKGD